MIVTIIGNKSYSQVYNTRLMFASIGSGKIHRRERSYATHLTIRKIRLHIRTPKPIRCLFTLVQDGRRSLLSTSGTSLKKERWTLDGLKVTRLPSIASAAGHKQVYASTYGTYTPIMRRPSFAASFFAAFLVLPRPRPKHCSSTIARTIQMGVVLVPSPALSL